VSVWNVYFDGCCDPNPGGVMAWGFGIDAGDGSLVTDSGAVSGRFGNTNNVAEYYALGYSVKRVIDLVKSPAAAAKFSGLHIRGDSQLVVNQVNDAWKVKAPALAQLHGRVLQLLTETGHPWVVEWVPREQNGLADELSRRAFFETTGRMPREYAKVKP
jgi:ribonuclease HI